jgi:hypothetical protein
MSGQGQGGKKGGGRDLSGFNYGAMSSLVVNQGEWLGTVLATRREAGDSPLELEFFVGDEWDVMLRDQGDGGREEGGVDRCLSSPIVSSRVWVRVVPC